MKKRIVRNKLLSLLLATILILGLLAGCGTTVENSPQLSEPSPSYSTPVSAPEVDEPASSSPDNTAEQENPEESIAPNPSEEPSTTPETTAPADPSEPKKPEEEPSSAPVATPPADSSFSIHFIDVGQADAALVECDGHYMLIDGGNKADSNVIYSVLKKASVPKLDIVVGSHGHEDHIGGLPGAYNYCNADLTLCPVTSYDSKAFEDFAKYAEQKGGGITVPKKNDTYALGSAKVTILSLNGGSDTNDTSIILRIDYGETSFLFTGDAEMDAEEAILNSMRPNLEATVLKVGHHGSDTSTSYRFLRAIMPKYAVISVGSGNSYGHPTEEALSRLRDADVEVFRTDMQGDIFCTSDGKTVSFSVSRNADADVFGGIGPNSAQEEPEESEVIVETPEPSVPIVIVPQSNTVDALTAEVATICRQFESDILDGTLTYSIISATEIEIYYDIDDVIYSNTEYLVDEVLDEVLNYVVDKLNSSDLPESVWVDATAYYDLISDSYEEEEKDEPVAIGIDYVGNRDSKKFHYAWCSSVDRMKESNKYYYTGTRDEMIAKGYVPCKNCNP